MGKSKYISYPKKWEVEGLAENSRPKKIASTTPCLKMLSLPWLENLHGFAASLSFESMCRTTPYHLPHLILLHEAVQYRRFMPLLKQKANNGGWFNLNEVLIRRERGNYTCSSLNIGLVLLATH